MSKILFYITSFLILLAGFSDKAAATPGPGCIALLGDSMTWIGGDNCQNSKGWSHYLREAMPQARIDVYARSGATWTNTQATKGDTEAYSEILDDENVVYNQIVRLCSGVDEDSAKTPDLIILYAGANDAWFEQKRPGMYEENPVEGEIENMRPSECTTLASSIELGTSILRSAFPEARLILVTPVEMGKISPDRISRVGDAIEKVGNRLGIEVLRADRNVAIRHDEEKTKRVNTYDGVHTNPAGARLIADYIINSITEEKTSLQEK